MTTRLFRGIAIRTQEVLTIDYYPRTCLGQLLFFLLGLFVLIIVSPSFLEFSLWLVCLVCLPQVLHRIYLVDNDHGEDFSGIS